MRLFEISIENEMILRLSEVYYDFEKQLNLIEVSYQLLSTPLNVYALQSLAENEISPLRVRIEKFIDYTLDNHIDNDLIAHTSTVTDIHNSLISILANIDNLTNQT